MPISRYPFTHAIAAFFEFPSDAARALLPGGIEPVELHPGTSLFSLTVFDFHTSEVGAYQEVVMSILSAPLLRKDERFPKAALFPFQVATSTVSSREHGIERWRLPHFPEDIAVTWHAEQKTLRASISTGGILASELTVSDHQRETVSDLYQIFMHDDTGRYMANLVLEGSLCEHEEERGSLRLLDSPFNRQLPIHDVATTPHREQWVTNGVEILGPLFKLD